MATALFELVFGLEFSEKALEEGAEWHVGYILAAA